MTHTPTPWTYRQANIHYVIESPSHATRVAEVRHVKYSGGSSEEDAAFIVRAVNAHDELVAALDNALGDAEAYLQLAPTRSKGQIASRVKTYRAALAKARG